jgi:hypothetical protein
MTACVLCARAPPLLQVRKVDDLRGDISRLELSVGAAKAEYDKIKTANLSETARFAAERRAEYVQMLENFTATQVGPCECVSGAKTCSGSLQPCVRAVSSTTGQQVTARLAVCGGCGRQELEA